MWLPWRLLTMQIGEGVFRVHSCWTTRQGLVFRPDEAPEPVMQTTQIHEPDIEAICAADLKLMRRDLVGDGPVSHMRFVVAPEPGALLMRMAGIAPSRASRLAVHPRSSARRSARPPIRRRGRSSYG